MKIVAVLCSTQENEGLRRSKASLSKNGIDVVVFGMGEAWQGNGMKQVAALSVARQSLGKYDLVLSMDAWDTLCFASHDEIVSKFWSFGHPMVVSAERNCWPDAKMASRYPSIATNSQYRFVNGGGYIAQTEYLVTMLEEWGVSKDFRQESDQRFLTQVFLKNPRCMRLDTECVIFQTLWELTSADFIQGGRRIINKENFSMPCIAHGNGHANMDWCWEMIK